MVRPSYEIPGFSFGGCKVEINRQSTYVAIRSWFRNSLEEKWFDCCTRSNIVSTSIMIQVDEICICCEQNPGTPGSA